MVTSGMRIVLNDIAMQIKGPGGQFTALSNYDKSVYLSVLSPNMKSKFFSDLSFLIYSTLKMRYINAFSIHLAIAILS